MEDQAPYGNSTSNREIEHSIRTAATIDICITYNSNHAPSGINDYVNKNLKQLLLYRKDAAQKYLNTPEPLNKDYELLFRQYTKDILRILGMDF